MTFPPHEVPEPGPNAHMRFECTGYGRTVTVEVAGADNTLIEVLERFEEFLRGCGYSFDGLEIVYKDEENEEKE